MTTVFDFLVKGGPTLIPIAGLSVVAMAYALERTAFWFRLLRGERRVARKVLEAARFDLREAETIAETAQDSAIGRFLLAPLKLRSPTLETFRLALEEAAEREFIAMQRGDRWFETVVGLAPLLGLLGSITSLMTTFKNFHSSSGSVDLNQTATQIGDALIPTATGLLVASLSLIVHRILIFLQTGQIEYFFKTGSELELIHRQVWYEPSQSTPAIGSDYSSTSEELIRRS